MNTMKMKVWSLITKFGRRQADNEMNDNGDNLYPKEPCKEDSRRKV